MKLTKKSLLNPTSPVTFEFPVALKKIADEMVSFMVANGGIGLAANQVGYNKSLFVMETEDEERHLHCFNPSIALTEGEDTHFEGCLSFPGEILEITRPAKIIANWQDHEGNEYVEEMTGMDAVCFQHELDHLNGITFHERKI